MPSAPNIRQKVAIIGIHFVCLFGFYSFSLKGY